jgi:hypothetical protein
VPPFIGGPLSAGSDLIDLGEEIVYRVRRPVDHDLDRGPLLRTTPSLRPAALQEPGACPPLALRRRRSHLEEEPLLAGRLGQDPLDLCPERCRHLLHLRPRSPMRRDPAGRRAELPVNSGWAEDRPASFAATFERDRHGFQASSPPPFRKLSGFRPTGAYEAGLSAGIKRTTPAP